ncbi:MAG: hypothetical protein C0508_23795 [Cyanobacteria bacterium PR.023]|nr:hypothetical protein [Cyanobacteria bacterium PR.023]
MNSTFAKEVVLNFDTFKNANFDRDTYGQEKDFISGADVEQVRRHQNFYREKEADLNAYAALAYDHRDDHEKRLLDRIDRDSHTTLQSGEGLWDVASRVLKQGGFASDREHVSKYADDLARLNAGKKMEPGTDLLLTHADIQATLYDIGMKGYRAHEDARLYDHRKAYVLRSEIIGFDTKRAEPQTSSWGAE